MGLQPNQVELEACNTFVQVIFEAKIPITTRHKTQDGFIAFSCIQLYTYKTLFTQRHAQYLGSLL